MFTYCLKCKKYEEPFDLKVLKTKKGSQCYHQNMLYEIVSNQNL